MAIEKIILRFRDLSTKKGDTVGQHKKIIDEKGFVYWGWWNKTGEVVPVHSFLEILNIIEPNGTFDIFLFDTGELQLFEAKIKDIRWGPRFEEIDSPDWSSTPVYYKNIKCKVWYKLTEIGNCIKEDCILHQWSYNDVTDLFETKKSIFNDFNNKQVSSFNELRHQERTLWFLRKYEEGDKIHEILLYDTSRVIPSNFPERIIETNNSVLLWLSDIHFSTEDTHAFPYKESIQTGCTLAEAIRIDLEVQRISKISGIIITGDLTWSASEDEFKQVMLFLKDMMSQYTLSPNQIILCPGNHDIAFSERPCEKDTPVQELTDKSRINFNKFYTELFSVTPNPHLASGRRFLLGKTFPVDVCSLNSSTLRQNQDVFQGHGYIGKQQQDFVTQEMGWTDNETQFIFPFRIVILHHHIVPVIPYEFAIYGQRPSVVYDAGNICNWIVKNHVNLVLHGHMHHSKVLKEKRSLQLMNDNVKWHEFTIASLGSTGVALKHNSLDRMNVYALIKFTDECAILKYRKINSTETDSSTDKTIVKLEISYK